MSTPDRLRIASTLLAPRDKEGMVRAPLSDSEAKAAIRAMPTDERERLTGHIDWVREYEAFGLQPEDVPY